MGSMEDRWDAVVVGAGVGGLSAASLLAKEGMRILVVEKDDRVGGRAMSLQGEEISGRGADWYRRLLGGQYCYLADASPAVEEAAEGRLLDGYILDLGYHGVSCAGEGYFALLRDLIGGYGDLPVKINPCLTGTWYKGEFYAEPPMHVARIDDKLYAELKRLGLNYLDFFGDMSALTPEKLQELDRVSLHQHLERTGFARSDILYEYWRCVGTLVTTINNPHDISLGDILRYSTQVIAPLIMRKGEAYVGGFTEQGVMRWSEAVAGRFRDFGGELRLGARLKEMGLEGGRVRWVLVETDEGEERLETERVVFSAPIQELFRYADEKAFPAEFASRIKGLYGYGSVCPYMGLSELPVPEKHAGRLMKTPRVVGREEGFDWDVYMAWNIQSYVEPSCAPSGKHLFTAYLPLTEKEARERELVAKVTRAVPDFLESVYPGFKEAVEWELYPVCVKLEGVAKSVSQAGSLKPDVVAPGVEGLYFAGDTARGYGVAMDCACSSGILCASAVTGRDYGIH